MDETRDRRGRRGSTVAQLRRDIDGGRTADKVAADDPAAAPLGTDDEAGGAPPRSEEVDLARSEEWRPGTAGRRRGSLAGGRLTWGVVLGGVAVLLLIVLIAAS